MRVGTFPADVDWLGDPEGPPRHLAKVRAEAMMVSTPFLPKRR
jgi:hypothetical protein